LGPGGESRGRGSESREGSDKELGRHKTKRSSKVGDLWGMCALHRRKGAERGAAKGNLEKQPEKKKTPKYVRSRKRKR